MFQRSCQSSAAFTVSAVITGLVANGRTDGVTQSDIVKLALKSEHRLGLVNGGMDVSRVWDTTDSSKRHRSFVCRASCCTCLSIRNSRRPSSPFPLPSLWSLPTRLNRTPLLNPHQNDTIYESLKTFAQYACSSTRGISMAKSCLIRQKRLGKRG